MKGFNELPMNIQEDIKETLKAFTKVTVWFENGEYHVSTGCMIKANYAPDEEMLGTWIPDDVYTEEEKMINYIESFHDYPAGYKGKRDYRMLDKIGNNWSVRFKFESGNLVVA